jgi:serine/threonine-protein kinase
MTTAAIGDSRDRVGPYLLIKAIGAGGSARIDLARIDRAYGFQRHVVLKRPLEHLRDDPKAATSLQREARIGGRLRHPNLVSVLDAGVHETYDYLVLEYIHGASLRTLMQADAGGQVREMPLAVALAVVTDTARGLHHAHELADLDGAPLGLVHRDVSPGNVLLGLDGTVKLADFGIAKETRVTTLSGSMHGTVTYMAPEQCRGHAFDRRADVFSLGVILYELVTGTRLFWADNDVASLHRVLSGTVPKPRKVKPTITAGLEDILLTALAPDPDRRYATARDLGDALERYAAEAAEVLTARSIARWACEVLGPREVPWIRAATIPDPVARGEGSLVDLIAAIADEPPAQTFGPVDEPEVPEPPTGTERVRPRSRAALASVIGLGLLGGIAGVLFVMSRSSSDSTPPPPPAPTTITMPVTPPPEPAPQPAPTPPVNEAAPEPEVVAPPEPIAKKRERPKIRKPAPVADPAPTPPPAPIAATGSSSQPNPKSEPKAAVGSGTQPAGAKPKSEPKWDPTLLLPTDGGSNKKR